MEESTSQKRRITILAANLVLLALCAGGLVVILAGYLLIKPLAEREPTPSSTAPFPPTWTWTPAPTSTQTPTPTHTPRQTSTPTSSITPLFTQTPAQTIIPSRTSLPSLTPAAALAYEGAYELADWDSEKANQMAVMMQGYPTGLLPGLAPDQQQAYFDAYQYPVFAFEEALLRFPESPQVEAWRWALAYNLALQGSPEAGEVYAGLIADNLNRDQVSLDELYAWFPIQEEGLGFFMVEGPVPPGYLASYIIELRSEGGSAFIWLLEKSAGFEAYPIWTHFDFANPRQANWILADLDNTPSNGQEIAIYYSTLEGETDLQPPRVFSLGKTAPVELPFLPEKDIFPIGMDFENYWALTSGKSGENELAFRTLINPTCPLEIFRSYRWNSLYFSPVETRIEFDELPAELAACELMIDQAIYYWGPESAGSLMETLLPWWPPETDIDGQPYPPDALDEWKYRLGVYRALAGDFDGAVELFNDVSTNPTVLTSDWIEPSQNFLAAYQKPEDIYTACRLALYCDPSHAIRYLAENIPNNVDALQSLQNIGVEIVSSGYFDFDDDDESERWFTVRNSPNQKLDFWILAKGNGYHEPLYIGIVETRRPTLEYIDEAYIADEGLTYQPAVILDGSFSFSMQRFPDTYVPFVVDVPLRKEYPSRFFVPLMSYKDALFAGTSPEVIQEELKNLEDYPGLLCKGDWSCDEYYYLLGLASELALDEKTAVEAYQRLWLDYSKSPFTQMARLKLVPLAAPPQSTIAPTEAPPPTLPPPIQTITWTPTLGGTPSTITPTFTGTLATSTPTITGTPPTSTPTVTGTQGTALSTPTATNTLSSGYPGPTLTITSPYP